jgi:hypothetical protein
MNSGDAVMSEAPSYSWTNRQYLLDVIMKKLNITQEDLEKDPSWIKAKVRDLRLDEVLS